MSVDKSWHEDDTFWKETQPILFPNSRVQEAEREVEQVLGLTGIPDRAAVLDLCCGIGRVAYGDFDGSPYDEKANRLVVVAFKQ